MITKSLYNKKGDSKTEEFLELLQTAPLQYISINSKYIAFYMYEVDYNNYFNNDRTLTPDDKVFFYPYFQGDSNGLNVEKNPIDTYKNSKHIIFPVSLFYTGKYKSKFSVLSVKHLNKNIYIFSKNWEKYLPLIIEGKLNPISFDKYYLKPSVRITEDMIPTLISMICNGGPSDLEIVQTILLSLITKDATKEEKILLDLLGTAIYYRGTNFFKTSKNVSKEVNNFVNNHLQSSFFDVYACYDKSNMLPKELIEKYMQPVYQYKMAELAKLYFSIPIKVEVTKVF
jgi:hypothetical protein